MNLMKTLLCLTMVFASFAAAAQTAFRCEENGATVYSEKPCPAAKAVASTQDSDAQRAQTEKANAQMRSDNAAVNREIREREAADAKARAMTRTKIVTPKTEKKKPKKAKAAKSSGKAKASKSSAAKKPKKVDNRMSKSS
jgi:hypothetical protein